MAFGRAMKSRQCWRAKWPSHIRSRWRCSVARGEPIKSHKSIAPAISRSNFCGRYTAQTEALAKLRRGGEQVVRVEHVHVHPGGQAIVGNVKHEQAAARGGVPDEKMEQPDAKPETAALAYAPVSPLRSQDPPREAVPVASGEREEALSDARGSEGIGSPVGKAKR